MTLEQLTTETKREPNVRRRAAKAVNERLYALGQTYHEAMPLHLIDMILTDNGFRAMEYGIYTGRDGHCTEQVGDGYYITVNWHAMEVSKRWEIVAYLHL